MRLLSAIVLSFAFASQAIAATSYIDYSTIGALGTATSSDSVLTIDASGPAWKKITFNADSDYYLDGTGQWSIPPGGDGTVLPEDCEAGQMLQYDGEDWDCVATPSPTFTPYEEGANIDITSGVIAVTGLDLADISDAGAAAYLDADNGEIGDVAVWVGVCTDTSFTDSTTCAANGGTWGPALPISVGAAEVEDAGGKFSATTLAGILQEIGGRVENIEDGTTGLQVDVQAGDPVAGDMTTGQVIGATTSGDIFIKTAGGLFTIAGTYAADASTCTTPSTGGILNEGFEGTGYENSGYWVTGGTGTIDPDNTPSGTGLTDSCAQNAEFISSGSGVAAYIEEELASALTYPVTVEFDLYVSAESLAQYNGFLAFNAWNSAWSTVGAVKFQEGATSSEYRIRTDGAAVESDIITADIETWHRVKIVYAATASESYIQVDGGTAKTFTRQSVDFQKFRFGLATASAAATVEIDRISISDGS